MPLVGAGEGSCEKMWCGRPRPLSTPCLQSRLAGGAPAPQLEPSIDFFTASGARGTLLRETRARPEIAVSKVARPPSAADAQYLRLSVFICGFKTKI